MVQERKRQYFAALWWAALACLWSVVSNAGPAGEKIVSGNVSFDRSAPGILTVGQLSDHAIIHWDDFSISPDELTQFVQTGADSAALNRVVGGNPSTIFGRLQANGQVFLINPAGILVGSSGQIDTKGFLASTLDITDESFSKRARLAFAGDSEAEVENRGRITALDGEVFLIARSVKNSGSIHAPRGTVGLAGADEVILTEKGPDRMRCFTEETQAFRTAEPSLPRAWN